jgi:hypothetical protein
MQTYAMSRDPEARSSSSLQRIEKHN